MLNVKEGIIVSFLHHFFVKESLPILDLSHCQVAFLYLREQLRVSLVNLVVAKVFLKYWRAMVTTIWRNLLFELRIVIEQRFLEFLLKLFIDFNLLQPISLNFFKILWLSILFVVERRTQSFQKSLVLLKIDIYLVFQELWVFLECLKLVSHFFTIYGIEIWCIFFLFLLCNIQLLWLSAGRIFSKGLFLIFRVRCDCNRFKVITLPPSFHLLVRRRCMYFSLLQINRGVKAYSQWATLTSILIGINAV